MRATVRNAFRYCREHPVSLRVPHLMPRTLALLLTGWLHLLSLPNSLGRPAPDSPGPRYIAVSSSEHDSAITVCNATACAVVLMERQHNTAHYTATALPIPLLAQVFRMAQTAAHAALGLPAPSATPPYTLGIWAGGLGRYQFSGKARAIQGALGARVWRNAPHHACHCAHALWDSGFARALVLSADGGGDDGTYVLWAAARDTGCRRIAAIPRNVGVAYTGLAKHLRGLQCPGYAQTPRLSLRLGFLAERMMHLAAQGTARAPWVAALRRHLEADTTAAAGKRKRRLSRAAALAAEPPGARGLAGMPPPVTEGDWQDYAASAQAALAAGVGETIAREFARSGAQPLVLTGGVALNTHLNAAIRARFRVPMHVPAAAGDSAITLGAVLAFASEAQPRSTGNPPAALAHTLPPTAFLGSPCSVADPGTRTSPPHPRPAEYARAEDVGRLLADGATVAVVRGCAEISGHSLGHRAVLASAAVPRHVATLQAVDGGGCWFTPLPLLMTERDACDLLEDWGDWGLGFEPTPMAEPQPDPNSNRSTAGTADTDHHMPPTRSTPPDDSGPAGHTPSTTCIRSPAGTLSATVRAHVRRQYPNLTCARCRPRVQTVAPAQDPWLAEVLAAVRARVRLGVLYHVGFLRPLVGTLEVALEAFAAHRGIDYLYVDGWLYAQGNTSTGPV